MDNRFFIVGAQRSGTTYLYQLCAGHPQIEMAQPVSPEPKFFLADQLYERSISFYESNFFSENSDAYVFGEKSTSYYESEKAARRIASHYPSAKIVFILRDPIQRAISNYWFSVKHGFEILPMSEAFLNEEKRWRNYDPQKVSVSPFAYLRRGRYMDYIELYEGFFPRQQIHIIIYEQLIKSDNCLAEFYGFLGVATDVIPDMRGQRVNANDMKPDLPISPELNSFLTNYFSEANSRLVARLGFPLTEWSTPRS